MSLQPSLEGLTDYRLRERTRLILALSEFRQEWQGITEGGSLMKIEAPVGLILFDIAEKLELTPEERHVFLGGKLINDANCVLEERVSKKLPN